MGDSIVRPRGAFLDRDGVLNACPPPHTYVREPSELRWLPGVEAATAALTRLGYVVVIVSNQRGLSRGMLTWHELHRVETAMREHLRRHDAAVASFHYCPHPRASCGCRKPAPGLILEAARQHRLDLGQSVVIGDSETDVLAGRAAGCRTIRIGGPRCRTSADAVADGLPAAVRLLAGEVTERPHR